MSPNRQLGLIWGGVAVALVGLSPVALHLAVLLPGCPFHALTGIPCPTCGATRAALALVHFDPLAALAVSPLAAVGWTALVAGGLLAGLLSLAGVEIPEPPSVLSPWQRVAVVAAVAANWLYLIATGA